jgi:hypothetical protein
MIGALYTITILELFLGGGGRLLAMGPVSARMVLFAPCVLVGACALVLGRRITRGQLLACYLVLAYLLIHLPGLLNGLARGADPSDLLTEFQQSLYWLAAPFYALALQSEAMVRRTATLVQVAGVILAVLYIGVLVGTLARLIDFVPIYERLRNTGELAGRSEGIFVYKGFLYLGLAIVFMVAMQGKYWKSLTLLVAAALVMTLTRGYILAATAAVLLLFAVQGRRLALAIGLAVALTGILLVWVYLPSMLYGNLDRSASNMQRIDDAQYIADHLQAGTYIIGEGFGSLINDRSQIENTFLWAFWKLGIPGVVFWSLPLILCAYLFAGVPKGGTAYRLACAYFFGVIFVYVQTVTNPYLNNPIGLSFVMAAIFSLQTLARRAPVPVQDMRSRAPFTTESAR